MTPEPQAGSTIDKVKPGVAHTSAPGFSFGMFEDMTQPTWTTVTTTQDLAAADVVCSMLESMGIEALVPDQHLAGVAWHLGQAIGGIRVQVRTERVDEARAVLASSTAEPDAEDEAEDDAEVLAHRAFKASVISTLLVFVAPYAMSLALRALASGGLSAVGFRQAVFAALISAAWPAALLYVWIGTPAWAP